MNRIPIGIVCIGLACLLGAAGCASKQAERQLTSASASGSLATTGGLSAEPSIPASVSVRPSDSLKACLTKISSDSSDGTRMVAEQSCQDNEKLHQGVIGTAIAKGGNRASAGTQGDSLNACMVGIPTDATAGQRMLAEESCKRDQLTHH